MTRKASERGGLWLGETLDPTKVLTWPAVQPGQVDQFIRADPALPFFQGCHRGARQLQGVRNLLLGEPPGSPRLLETLPQNPRDDGVDNTLMH